MSSTNLIKIHAAGAGKTYGICNEAIANCKNKRTKVLKVCCQNSYNTGQKSLLES